MGRVIVVGAGVVGLTCAVRLLEAGHRVDVVARDLPLETTSVVAAALWYPYRALPQDRVTAWSRDVVRRPRRRSPPRRSTAGRPTPACGCVRGTEVFARAAARPVVALRRSRAWTGSRAAARATRDGWTLPRPGRRDAASTCAGWSRGSRDARRHPDPAEPRARCPTGRTSSSTAPGLGVAAARRATARSCRCAARWSTSSRSGAGRRGGWTAPGRRTSCPRAHDVVVGGTDEEGEWSRTPSPEDAPRTSCAGPPSWCRALRGARVLRHKVGLRPVRPAVRLERGRRRRALLRPRRRRRDAELGLRRRRRGAGRRPRLRARFRRAPAAPGGTGPRSRSTLKGVAFHALSNAYSIGFLVCGIAALVAALVAVVFLGGRPRRDTFVDAA